MGIEIAKYAGRFEQRVRARGRINLMQFAGSGVAAEGVAHARSVIRRIAGGPDGIQPPVATAVVGIVAHIIVRTSAIFATIVRAIVRTICATIAGTCFRQRRRDQFAESPRTPRKKVLGGIGFRHHGEMRQTIRAIRQGNEMPMQCDPVDGQPTRTLQNRWVARIMIWRADRHVGRTGERHIPLFATIRRPGRHAHAFAEPVRRLM